MGTPNNDFMALALSLYWTDQRVVIMRGYELSAGNDKSVSDIY